ncbi:MAG TPA: tetratricopeptide repeat protein [Acidimicrobiales bacterium]|nr:tetratricopeptide repeat protein [Acidimicrobiales bacterium]
MGRSGDRAGRVSDRGTGGRGAPASDRGPRGGGGDRRPPTPREPGLRGPRAWGGIARRGAGRAATEASDAFRAAAPSREDAEAPEAAAWQAEEWIDEGELRDEASGAVGRSRATGRPDRRAGRPAGADAEERPGRARRPSPAGRGAGEPGDDLAADVRKAVPANRVERFESRLRDASDAFRRERYEDARRMLRPLAEQAPGASSVRELYGLTLYRLGRWAQAQRELEAFRTQTASTEQHPVLADCYRALGRYAEVEELWEELREASPSAELVAEGRIVAAGALADQGRLPDAIELLEAAPKRTGRPKLHHLRIAYALADLYERAGELPRARELFGLVADSDPDFVDIQARLRALR